MARIDIRTSQENKEMLQQLAKANNLNLTTLILDAVLEKYKNENSIYPEYLAIIEKINSLEQTYEAIRDYTSSPETENEKELYELLHIAEQLLIRADAVINDENLTVQIDEELLDIGEKPYTRSRFAYCNDYKQKTIEFIELNKQ